MGGGSLGFTGSAFSFWTALLKAYWEENQRNDDQNILFYPLRSPPNTNSDVYLSLDPPKLRLFSTVHLTVDDQDVGEASDVASLHL